MPQSNGITTISLVICLSATVAGWGCEPSVAVQGAEGAEAGSSSGGCAAGSECSCPDGLADCYGNGCNVDPSQDPLNCGACGVSCAEGGCNAGVCGPPPEIFATRDGEVWAIAVDDMAVYWSEVGAIVRQPKGGGEPTVLAETKTLAHDIALDDGYVYWAESDAGTVARAPKAGGPTEIIATGEAKPFAIEVDASAVYWTNILGKEIRRSPKNEGLPQKLIGGVSNPYDLAVDAEAVYWTSALNGDGVGRIPKIGGVATTLFPAEGIPGSIAIDGSDVYFWLGLGASSGQIRRGSKLGGAMNVVTPLEPKWIGRIIVDSTHVYWCSSGLGNMLKRGPKEGGVPLNLASGDYACSSIVVDATHVYWSDGGHQRVLRTPK